MTPMKAIRKHCVECSGFSFNEVKLCPVYKCPLYPYRFGHRPKVYTDMGGGAFENECGASPQKNSKEALCENT